MDDSQINKPLLTRALNLPLAKFKKPTRQSKNTSESNTSESPVQLGIEFSNGRFETVKLDGAIVLGRKQSDTDVETILDLSQTGQLDNGVSRSHAILHSINGIIYVTDNKSLNGTYLNGAELYPMRNYVVNDGDTLKLGSVELRLKFIS